MVTIKFEFTESILDQIMQNILNGEYCGVILGIAFCFPLCFILDNFLIAINFIYGRNF